jgi:hypothetical protein
VPLDPDPAVAGTAEVTEDGDTENADTVEDIEEQRLAAL